MLKLCDCAAGSKVGITMRNEKHLRILSLWYKAAAFFIRRKDRSFPEGPIYFVRMCCVRMQKAELESLWRLADNTHRDTREPRVADVFNC